MRKKYVIMPLEGEKQIPSVYKRIFDDIDDAYKTAHSLCDNTEYDDFVVYEVYS